MNKTGRFGLAIASLFTTAVLVQWQAIKVALARQKAKIPYPLSEFQNAKHLLVHKSVNLGLVYADRAEQDASREAMIFNCTQRTSATFCARILVLIMSSTQWVVGAHQNTLEHLPTFYLSYGWSPLDDGILLLKFSK